MSSTIVRVKNGFDFEKELEESRKRLAYYEEGLLIDVAARIIDAMETRGLTRSALARHLNVSPAYITKILRGHANLSLESLAKLAFALDLKWECLLIPKDARIGLLSLTDEAGNAAICTVERATVVTQAEATSPDEDASPAVVRERPTADQVYGGTPSSPSAPFRTEKATSNPARKKATNKAKKAKTKGA